ncbi:MULTISPECIES: COG4223 family protein [unclassified Agrobacterium]|uniref:COG4223 family protein n=1 Tax=unclassified Agrobacterium TaxID=2632611 RepID=UPI0024472038|nr:MULTISPECIES: COG4223 family protein [unclassified Agrobacterium]MDH0614653.1 COG4223 family protein [Agrobacterium sp. GD03872]MDH0697104.1 COG4223 family protein [Agrobacterium sp. GD03871]MDH1059584.1 COG4223 family protein [Agrobacterium sp. GD03992]MDH2212445.1 COG4223 family protein [Agrobacterium sp. GD03643]MDH2219933.1 COG4223 family protein [Agrobacterium sp. GD03638]
MVSGKPPRHSKSKAEPVTIDLDAKDVKAISADEDAAKTDEKPGDKTPAATAEPGVSETKPEAAVTGNPAPIWDQPKKTPIEPEPNVGKAESVATAPKAESSADKQNEPVSTAPVPPKADTKTSTGTAETSTAAAAAAAAKPAFGSTVSSSASSGATAAKPSATSTSSGPAKPSAPQQAERKPAATSGLIAAGIVGGLVALAAAGSMQYAGILPSFNADKAGSEEITTLKTDLGNLRQQLANAPAANTSALEQRIATLEGAKGEAPQVDGLSEKIAALESALQSERSAQASATAELTRRLADAEAKINEPRDDIEVARAIASAALKAAIDRGGPFLTELDTLSRVTPDDPAIASLQSFAATGVPSRSELMQKFPDVANAMLSAINQPDPNQGIMERLTESAFSLVKVRPVGNIEGETAEAMIARMENKLRNGDLQGAALEWNGLPHPAKTASADYKKSLDARIEVENLVGGTLNRAITSTGRQG